MGARHFIKEELPRIRWANPLLDIAVKSVPKTRDETWPAQAVLEFQDGTTSTLNMSNKWSTTIAKELMDLAGGDPWKAYKSAALAAGHPILPGEEKERLAQIAKRSKASTAKAASPQELETQVQEMLNAPSRPKTGAAAILP
jgi:small subunit ribosomal protein S25